MGWLNALWLVLAIAMPDHSKNPHAVALGRLGGLKGGPARSAKLSARKRSQIAKLAALARWGAPLKPVRTPIAGDLYYGVECDCGSLLLLARDPFQGGPSVFLGSSPMPIKCGACGAEVCIPARKWRRYVAP